MSQIEIIKLNRRLDAFEGRIQDMVSQLNAALQDMSKFKTDTTCTSDMLISDVQSSMAATINSSIDVVKGSIEESIKIYIDQRLAEVTTAFIAEHAKTKTDMQADLKAAKDRADMLEKSLATLEPTSS